MRVLGRVATTGALIEVACWAIATTLRRGAWRYDISALYAHGSPRPWLVMAGECALAAALVALALGLRRFLPRSDHRMIGCAMLGAAGLGGFVGGLARDSCEESVPACAGHAYATLPDWLEAGGSLLLIVGVAGAALVLTPTLSRPWAAYSAVTGLAVLGSLLIWRAVPYPWIGTAERLLALTVAAWVASLGALITYQAPRPHRSTPTRSSGRPHQAAPHQPLRPAAGWPTNDQPVPSPDPELPELSIFTASSRGAGGDGDGGRGQTAWDAPGGSGLE